MLHDASSTGNVQAMLAFMSIRGVGRQTAIDLWRTALNSPGELGDEPAAVFVAVATGSAKVHGSETVLCAAWRTGERQAEEAHEVGLRVVSYFDDDYPERLRDIPDPPAVLFIKGRVEALHEAATVAVVGTREPTKYGVETAFRAGKRVAERGVTVVSGLALGCDTQAHKGCVSENGTGVAVLAHGLDRVYPAGNRGLADLLLESGGCWVSEYPVGTKPERGAFVERDRIQSGLADGVLVVETDVKGGTMHTVRYSQQQHRRLACVDHPEKWWHHPQTRGNRKLIDSGEAAPLREPDDMERFLSDILLDSTSSPEPDHRNRAESDRHRWGNETKPRLVPDEIFDEADASAQPATSSDDKKPTAGSESEKQMPMLRPEGPDTPTAEESSTYRPSGDAVIFIVVDDNPKRAGTGAHTRFGLYVSGMTVEAYISAGGKMDEIYGDIARTYIVVSDYPYAELAQRV